MIESGLGGKVRYFGQRNNVKRLYQAMNRSALPSHDECQTYIGVQAQEAGLPCFLSDTIMREVDVTGRVYFLLINDQRIWSEALSALVKTDEERFAVNRTAFSVYSGETQGEWLTKKYLELQEEAFL